ncbi:DNA-3-methyladenine glycosylase family protein [Speluncibacter jeojiensis]|uniref:DNA-3-methyladenine glycosylase II n=1 Tax=Speluncibacter jeojiensis TaxID=2710754 RepID=A0A9X4LYF4_9ACTN|nr:hypothetical protein [Corynebacteriales bacterium D3-21]
MFRAPFDRPWMDWFLRAHAAPGIESYEGGCYRTSVPLPHGPALISLRIGQDHVVLDTDANADRRDEAELLARIRRFLDLDADPLAVDRTLSADPRLAPLVSAAPGIRLPGCLDPHELLLRTMLGQQVSVAAARTAVARLARALGEPLHDPTGRLTHRFPASSAIAEHGAAVLTGPGRRVRSVIAVAAALADGTLRLDAARDPGELRAELLTLPGIGPWTAAYVGMRLLRDPDVLLSTDLVVRHGAELVDLDVEDTGHLTPWRSYASLHLWRVEVWRRAGLDPAAPPDRADPDAITHPDDTGRF